MREIKFRAWDRKDKVMREVTGINFLNKDMWLKYSKEKLIGANFFEVKLMQYTGLKDKNGKEIFEGDIVKCTELTNDRLTEYVSEVFWEDYCYFVHESKYCDSYLGTFEESKVKYPLTEIEVIGDIYRNPNLLGAKP